MNKLLSAILSIILITLFYSCSSDNDDITSITPKVSFQDTGTVEHSISGETSELFIEITAPVGTLYSLTIQNKSISIYNNDWCLLPDGNKTKKSQISNTTQLEKILCNPNSGGAPRTATILVTLSTGHIFYLELTQDYIRPEEVPVPIQCQFRISGTASCSVGGYEDDILVDLQAPIGTGYIISVQYGSSWCWTSRQDHSIEKTEVMIAKKQTETIYLSENRAAERMARISVSFSTGESFYLTISQGVLSSDLSGKLNKPWIELPVCKTGSNQTIVDHYCTGRYGLNVRNYTMLYDTQECIARWVAYPIHSSYMEAPYVRSNAWAYDPKVPTNQQADLDGRSYQGGYIRGHQCMSNHRYVQASTEMNAQTFYSTNIMPQNSTFNSGLWGSMEQICTAQSCSDTLYCVTGNWGTRGYATDQNGKRIAAPEYCFKVILRTRSGRTGKRIDQITDASQLKAIGYWAANASSSNSGSLRDYTVSVAEIESKTGYKFFPMLDKRIADQVKAQNNPSDFGIN